MIIKAKTITEAVDKATRYQLGLRSGKMVYGANALHTFNVQLIANSCHYEWDVRKLWLFKGRWTRLVRQYIDRTCLDRFVEQARDIASGTARKGASTDMLFKDPDRAESNHKWGGCMMGLTFHRAEKKAVMTMYSRTCFMGYIGLLDVAIPALIVQKEIGLNPAKVSFRWHITAMQLHAFKILPYIHNQPDLMKELRYRYRHRRTTKSMGPVWANIVRYYCKMRDGYSNYGLSMLEICKYGGWRRIQRRWLEHMGHLPKKNPTSLLTTSLDFEKVE